MTTTTKANKPPTAKKLGRPAGAVTELVKAFVTWPFGEWIEWTAQSPDHVRGNAQSIRNAARRMGIVVSVLTDEYDNKKLHVLKKETEDGTQE